MGTPEFAVPSLEALIEGGHEVVAVVTQPDKPKGRGKAMAFTPVKEKALQYGIDVLQPVRVKEVGYVDVLAAYKPDVVVVVAFGQILPKDILELPKYGCICGHASLLPKYRGAAPIQWAVINGEKESGITAMQMDEGCDTGDILLKSVVELDEKETGGTLHDKLSIISAELLIETLKEAEAGNLKPVKQGESTTEYAKMLTKTMGKINFTKSAVEIERLIRGLNPWPSAYTYLDGKTLKIWTADVIEEESEGAYGEIVAVGKDFIHVKTGDGILSLTEIQLEGKKRMNVDAFLRGFSIEKGTILE